MMTTATILAGLFLVLLVLVLISRLQHN